jgi:hypothetical protein
MEFKSQLEIPLERVEHALFAAAIPGFYGDVTIELRLMNTAAFEVEMTAKRKTISQGDVSKDQGPVVPTNERVSKIRAKLSEISPRVRLYLPVTTLRAVFKDGHLVAFEVTECDVPGPMQRVPRAV